MKVPICDFIEEFEGIEDKSERANFFLDNVESICTWYIKRSFKQGELEMLKELTQLINTKRFFKTFKAAWKMDASYCVEFCTVIGDYLEEIKRLGKEYQPTDELKEAYAELLEKILKDRSKELSAKTGLPADLVINLLVTMPTNACISSPKFVGIQLSRVNRKIYRTVSSIKELDDPNYGLTPKQFKILYSELFGKDLLPDIAIANLLDRKDAIKDFNDRQLRVYNTITQFSLEMLNKQEKDECLDMLAVYIQRRRDDENNKRDGSRRVKLQEIDADEYSRLAKSVSKVIADKPEFARFL